MPNLSTNLEKIHYYFQSYESPEHFITVDYLFCIASCLGRRVMLQEGQPIFPNEYFILVGGPAVGKSITAKRMTDELKTLMRTDDSGKLKPLINVASSAITLEKLYQIMEGFSEVIKAPDGKPVITSATTFMLADELGLLFYDDKTTKKIIQVLNAGYDCTSKLDYDTKQNGTNIILNVCINLLGCATPAWIKDNFPPSLLDNGFGSRIIFVWGEKPRQITPFLEFSAEQNKSLADVKEHWKNLTKVSGLVVLSKEAKDFYINWRLHEEQKYLINKDPKLTYYYSRKNVHLRKLAMLFHFSEKMDLVLTEDDLKQALSFLSFLEKDMHKALASTNINPTASLAEEIKRALETNKGMKRIQIIHNFFGAAQDGMQSIEDALGFLQQTGQCALNQNTQKWEVLKASQKLEELKQDE